MLLVSAKCCWLSFSDLPCISSDGCVAFLLFVNSEFPFFLLLSFGCLHGVGQFVLNDPPKDKMSKFDGFCNFARKSFGSSFEHLFKVCWVIFFLAVLCVFTRLKSSLHILAGCCLKCNSQLSAFIFIFQF